MTMQRNATIETLLDLSLRGNLPVASRVLISVAASTARWSRNARTRKHLARLSDRELADIGVTQYQADREQKKYFWMP